MQEDADRLFYLGIGPITAILLGVGLIPFRGLTITSNFTFAFVGLTILAGELGGRGPALATALSLGTEPRFLPDQPLPAPRDPRQGRRDRLPGPHGCAACSRPRSARPAASGFWRAAGSGCCRPRCARAPRRVPSTRACSSSSTRHARRSRWRRSSSRRGRKAARARGERRGPRLGCGSGREAPRRSPPRRSAGSGGRAPPAGGGRAPAARRGRAPGRLGGPVGRGGPPGTSETGPGRSDLAPCRWSSTRAAGRR